MPSVGRHFRQARGLVRVSDQQPSAEEQAAEVAADCLVKKRHEMVSDYSLACVACISTALSDTRRKAYEDAARWMCIHCERGNVAQIHPQDERFGYWHLFDDGRGGLDHGGYSCLAYPIWRRLAKGSTGEGERND